MRPRTLPIAVPPARHETSASYLARLAALHGLDGDELWKRVSVPTPSPARRTIDIHQLSALTGRPPSHLAGALLELRDPPPTWEAFRHIPQIDCPRCDAHYPGGPVFRIFPHHRYVCTRHQYWIGPPDINHPGPNLEIFPDIVTAQRQHLRLVRRHGWAAAYDAVLTAFMICAHLWEQDPDDNPGMALNQAVRNVRSFVFIPKNTEQETFSASWIEQDCWRPPSPPPTTFAAAPGHRRPGHLDTTVTRANRERHDKAVLWFSRKRRPGQVILHHRTVHPVVIREWSTQMEHFAGAIWQSQRTMDRFKAVP
ncbi:TniQ family protein [Nonomuraea sp. NPDC049152]|uniref:TniQ family protein n=1 Tax=Nonomuraea sp. NPDC049152 TaxID=3154350 RepID=UPI0033DF45AB